MTPEDILKTIYYDPKSGHTGAQQLYLRVQKPALEAGIKITMAKVQAWLKEQKIHRAFAPNGKDKPTNWFKITDIPNSYQADTILEDKYKAKNGGYRGFLLFVEITTRMAYAYPFKTGSEKSPPNGDEALEIFKKFEADRFNEKHPVARISGDKGGELTNHKVAQFLREKHVQTYFHRPADHYANGLLNTVARYARRIIERDIEHSSSVRWVDKLPDAVANWNEHRIMNLKASPEELWDDKDKRQQVRENALIHNAKVWKRTALKDGDVVKTYLRRNTKEKGLWQKESATFAGEYKIVGRKGYSFELEDVKGEAQLNKYRAYELRTVPNPSLPEEVAEEEHPRDVATREDRVRRKVQIAVGKGATERIQREKRETKAPERMNLGKEPAKPRAAAAPKIKAQKGKVLKIPEYVIAHRVIDGKLEFKVKWKHLSIGESMALEWQPLRDFYEEVGAERLYVPVIYEYLNNHPELDEYE